ncbi:MAG: pentapeptide repeat-containing protein [Mycobacteriaceae bacterium]|nr:pentapeptide repeat-containing protein [Mycobacteriaceae bacterium]
MDDARGTSQPRPPHRRSTWLWIAGVAIVVTIATLGGLGVAAAVNHWGGYWKSAAQPYATVLTGLAALSAAALALYNGERQRAEERERWSADQHDSRAEADRSHNREVTRELRSRFTTATEQLADDSPTIRRSGAYAMAALADDWYNRGEMAEVGVCFDVLTAYLRELNAGFDSKTHSARADGSVRVIIATLILNQRTRPGHPWCDKRAPLKGADLRGVDLTGASLAGANLAQADMKFANLAGADLQNAILAEADLSHAQLCFCNLRKAILVRAKFNGANLSPSALRGASIGEADFSGANLARADLSAVYGSANFTGADLTSSYLDDSRPGESCFAHAIVKDANVAHAHLSDVVLEDVSLADFSDIYKAQLSKEQREKYADAIAKSRTEGDEYERKQVEERARFREEHPWMFSDAGSDGETDP